MCFLSSYFCFFPFFLAFLLSFLDMPHLDCTDADEVDVEFIADCQVSQEAPVVNPETVAD
jgi:hypothetical protein